MIDVVYEVKKLLKTFRFPPQANRFPTRVRKLFSLLVISIYSFLRSNAATLTDAIAGASRQRQNKIKEVSPPQNVYRERKFILHYRSKGANRFLLLFRSLAMNNINETNQT